MPVTSKHRLCVLCEERPAQQGVVCNPCRHQAEAFHRDLDELIAQALLKPCE